MVTQYEFCMSPYLFPYMRKHWPEFDEFVTVNLGDSLLQDLYHWVNSPMLDMVLLAPLPPQTTWARPPFNILYDSMGVAQIQNTLPGTIIVFGIDLNSDAQASVIKQQPQSAYISYWCIQSK